MQGLLHFSERMSPRSAHFSERINKKIPRKSPKSKEKHYLCLHKRSVTSMRECPIGQGFETDGGHSINGLERGGTRRMCKSVKDNDLHLSPFPVNLSEVRLYRLR